MNDKEILALLKHELMCCSLEDDFGQGYRLKDLGKNEEEQRAFTLKHSRGFEFTVTCEYCDILASVENDDGEHCEMFKVPIFQFNNGYIRPQLRDIAELLADSLMAYAGYLDEAGES